jgi:hypothetical protein
MPQLHLPLKDDMLVEALAVSAGPVSPVGDGALVEPERDNDGLHRTAVAKEGDDDRHQVHGFLEAVERGVAGGGEGLAAGGTAVTVLLAAMDADVPQAELAPCSAVGVVAALGERVHQYPSRGTVWRSCLEECLVDPRFARGYPPLHDSMGCYRENLD